METLVLSAVAVALLYVLLNLIVSRRHGHGYPTMRPLWYWRLIIRKWLFGTRSRKGVLNG
jgi:hypothetical protein